MTSWCELFRLIFNFRGTRLHVLGRLVGCFLAALFRDAAGFLRRIAGGPARSAPPWGTHFLSRVRNNYHKVLLTWAKRWRKEVSDFKTHDAFWRELIPVGHSKLVLRILFCSVGVIRIVADSARYVESDTL
jgi:hypothetical protein